MHKHNRNFIFNYEFGFHRFRKLGLPIHLLFSYAVCCMLTIFWIWDVRNEFLWAPFKLFCLLFLLVQFNQFNFISILSKSVFSLFAKLCLFHLLCCRNLILISQSVSNIVFFSTIIKIKTKICRYKI